MCVISNNAQYSAMEHCFREKNRAYIGLSVVNSLSIVTAVNGV